MRVRGTGRSSRSARPSHRRSPTALWPRSGLDRFVLARLEQAELTPAPAAERRALLRRVTFDLTGLPPTAAEAEAFAADTRPNAYEELVDRLLDSPHFGERWARHWLDVVRYADTRGHEYDFPIPNAYQYRDYVIRALNDDVPFDRFVTEHVAGDLLAEPRRHATEGWNESVLGTGFWYLGEEVHSPVDIRGDETERIANQVDVLSKAFLGLTVACARCHDHKFDAITTRDYYALAGFPLSSSYRQVRFETTLENAAVAEELGELKQRHEPGLARRLGQALVSDLEGLAERLLAARSDDRWLAAAKQDGESGPFAAWTASTRKETDFGERLELVLDEWDTQAERAELGLRDAVVLVDYGSLDPGDWIQDGFVFGVAPSGSPVIDPAGSRAVVGLRRRAVAVADPAWDELELAPDVERVPGSVDWVQSGRTLVTPTFTLPPGKLYYLARGSADVFAAVDSHRLIHGPLHAALMRRLDGDGEWKWIEHDLSEYEGHTVHVELTPRPGQPFELAMVVAAQSPPGLVEPRNRLLRAALGFGRVHDREGLAQAYEDVFLEAARRLRDDRLIGYPDAADQAELLDWILRRPELCASIDEQIAGSVRSWFEARDAVAARIRVGSRTAPAILDGSGRDERILVRGSHHSPGEPALRSFLEAVDGAHPLSIAQGSGRLELAQRMTDPANPFLARVRVNRVWSRLFGRGIVPSVDDFGVMGEPPSHPYLLDWLARRFVKGGWSTKQLVRELVLSSTYRMSSRPDAAGAQIDPDNRLLHRMPVRRLDAEAIRDAVLAVSGMLDPQLYGPTIPIHLTPFMEGRGRPAASGPLDGAGRRSLYISVRRNFLLPFLQVFDFPSPATTTGRRTVSNVPAQALTMMNDPFVVQAAERWAEKALGVPAPDPAARIQRLYLDAFGRTPVPTELETALGFLGGREGVQAWSELCHVLLNVKEFVFLN